MEAPYHKQEPCQAGAGPPPAPPPGRRARIVGRIGTVVLVRMTRGRAVLKQ